MGSVGDINCVLFRFFFWDGYWGNVFRDSDGYFGELLNIEEELDEMYQRFLARLRERYPDEGDDGEEK